MPEYSEFSVSMTSPRGVRLHTAGIAYSKNIVVTPQLQTAVVTPSSAVQTLVPDGDHAGFSGVTVGAAPLEEKTVFPAQIRQTVTPSEGKYGLSCVTVMEFPLQHAEVVSTGLNTMVYPEPGYRGFSEVLVKGVSLQNKSVTPSSSPRVVTADVGYTGLSSVTVAAAPGDGSHLKVSRSSSTAPDDTDVLWVKTDVTPSKTAVSSGFDDNYSFIDLEPSAVLPVPLFGTSAAAFNGKCYLFGGSPATTARTSDIRIFDPAAGTFTLSAVSLDQTLDGIAACTVGGKIYLFGGRDDTQGRSDGIRIYDPAAGTLTVSAVRLPVACSNIGVCAIDDKIYLFGGRTGSNGALDTVLVYDTTEGTLSASAATLPAELHSMAVCAVGTKCYLFGGSDRIGRLFPYIRVYDTLTDTVSTLTTEIPESQDSPAAAVFGKKCIIISSISNTIYEYDTAADVITLLSAATKPIRAGNRVCCAEGNVCYLFGGFNVNDLILDRVEGFEFSIPLASGVMEISAEFGNGVALIDDNALTMSVDPKTVWYGVNGKAHPLHFALHDGTRWSNVC